MLCALLIGAGAGLLHGTVITRGRIEPFIVTLGTLGIFRSVLTYLSQGGSISLGNDLSDAYSPVFYGKLLGIPIPILVFAAVALLGGLILNRTRYGRYVQATGSNEQVARYAAVNVTRVKIVTYVIQGLCVALATLLYVPRLGSASPSTGLLVGTRSHRRRHHRRHGPQGRLGAHLGHGGRRDLAGHHRERPQPHLDHQRVPERRRAGRGHHHRGVHAARQEGGITVDVRSAQAQEIRRSRPRLTCAHLPSAQQAILRLPFSLSFKESPCHSSRIWPCSP